MAQKIRKNFQGKYQIQEKMKKRYYFITVVAFPCCFREIYMLIYTYKTHVLVVPN